VVLNLFFKKKLCRRYKIAPTAQTDFKGIKCRLYVAHRLQRNVKIIESIGGRSWNQARFFPYCLALPHPG
jgi:hypothetical protein